MKSARRRRRGVRGNRSMAATARCCLCMPAVLVLGGDIVCAVGGGGGSGGVTVETEEVDDADALDGDANVLPLLALLLVVGLLLLLLLLLLALVVPAVAAAAVRDDVGDCRRSRTKHNRKHARTHATITSIIVMTTVSDPTNLPQMCVYSEQLLKNP